MTTIVAPQIQADIPQLLDDPGLLREGHAALRERLGFLGSLRFLRLVTGQADRFEEIRTAWEDVSEEELFARPAEARAAQPGSDAPPRRND